MEKIVDVLKILIDKLNLKQILLTITIVIGLMVLPRINFLAFLVPSNDIAKILRFIFPFLLCFFLLEIIRFIYGRCRKYLGKRREVKREAKIQAERVKQLQEVIELLPDEDKQLLQSFIKNENKPQIIDNCEQLDRLCGRGSYRILQHIKTARFNMRDITISPGDYYKIGPDVYKDIVPLYKIKQKR